MGNTSSITTSTTLASSRPSYYCDSIAVNTNSLAILRNLLEEIGSTEDHEHTSQSSRRRLRKILREIVPRSIDDADIDALVKNRKRMRNISNRIKQQTHIPMDYTFQTFPTEESYSS